jgi:hypothetical protein
LKERDPSTFKAAVASVRDLKGEASDTSIENSGLTDQFRTWGQIPWLDDEKPTSNVVPGKKCRECFRTNVSLVSP